LGSDEDDAAICPVIVAAEEALAETGKNLAA
jgi:hypothetical protein